MLDKWVTVVASSSVADGEVVGTTVDELEIAIYRIGGELFATNNVCTHALAFLSDGWLDGEIIECPLHGGKFEVKSGEGPWRADYLRSQDLPDARPGRPGTNPHFTRSCNSTPEVGKRTGIHAQRIGHHELGKAHVPRIVDGVAPTTFAVPEIEQRELVVGDAAAPYQLIPVCRDAGDLEVDAILVGPEPGNIDIGFVAAGYDFCNRNRLVLRVLPVFHPDAPAYHLVRMLCHIAGRENVGVRGLPELIDDDAVFHRSRAISASSTFGIAPTPTTMTSAAISLPSWRPIWLPVLVCLMELTATLALIETPFSAM